MIETQDKLMVNLELDKSLPQEVVDISDKKRSNLFMWRGQFSPQLVEALIQSYGSKGSTVFDPFLGSGTVISEASLFGLDVYGTELNPAAFGLASIYSLINVLPHDREDVINEIDDVVNDYLPLHDLFNHHEGKPLSCLQNELVKLYKQCLPSVKSTILNNLIIGLDFGQKQLSHERLQKAWFGLKQKVKQLPYSENNISISLGDARKTHIADNTVDLVITSPPYINVFNYHQNYRRSVEATGYNVLDVAKSEIGANRKFRSNRYLTVVQFALDIYLVFRELYRVCNQNAKVIFIVGRESSVRKTPFPNAKILEEVALLAGFTLKGQQERMFKNKFGQDIYEDILRFGLEKNKYEEVNLEHIRSIGLKYLKLALRHAPDESINDLNLAIEKYQQVFPSPIFNQKQ